MSRQQNAKDESVVRLRGLPWDATEADIAEFFQGKLNFDCISAIFMCDLQVKFNKITILLLCMMTGLQIKQNNGIHIPHNKNGRASGEAFVHFETLEDCDQALDRNMNKLGHRFVTIFPFFKKKK